VVEDAADGDDYIEGNGGNDRIYGNLGSDDIVGGSSSLFGLGEFDTVADPARPDGADLIYGAAGDAARLARGADTVEDPGYDSDVILGDNGNIYRLVDEFGAYRTFNYDATDTIIPRPVDLLDYGYDAQFSANLGTGDSTFTMADLLAATGYGAGDLIYGEDGDDFIHGQTGDDVIFGNAGNDSLHGERGNDVIYGGAGEDGILGDDGLLKVSRLPSDPGGGPNATAFMVEELWGINEELQVDLEIATPGNLQRDIINDADSLRYSVDLLAFRTGTTGEDQQFNDIIFGGFDTDWMHGGDGDDAISGAEALSIYYDAEGGDFGGVNDLLKSSQRGTELVGSSAYDVQDDPFWYAVAIYNPGNILRHEGKTAANGDGNGNFGDVTAEFAAYDSYNPRDRVYVDPDTGLSVPIDELTGNEIEFILNFDAEEGDAETNFPEDDADLFTDGDDRIFGDLGNDWIVGGTGRDNMYGGRGNDLLNMDDQHDTALMLNTEPDAYQAYGDQAYGGAGRDVLILNTGADRAIDWVGEFNSYIVPFSPFGAFHISRSLQPHLAEFLLDLSEADGSDQTGPDFALYLQHKVADARTDAPDPDRNFEPFGELGMVRQQDYDWGDQTGAPADPQAGNLQGQREIMRRALFADEPLQGGGGSGGGGNGNGQGFAPTAGTWSVENGVYNASTTLDGEAVSIFPLDEQQPTYMEILATINADKDKAGFKSNGYIIFDMQSETEFKFAGVEVGTDKIQIGQHSAENGWEVLTQTNLQLKHETDYDLTLVMYGTVATLYVDQANATAFDFGAALNTGYVGLGTDNSITRFDDWQVQKLPPEITFEWPADFTVDMGDLSAETAMWTTAGATLVGTPTGDPAIAARPVDVQHFSMLELEAVLDGTGSSGFVFDYYSTTEYKFATYDADTGEVTIGHVSNGKTTVDTTANVAADGAVEMVVNMRGTQVSVEIDGTAVAGHLYNAILNDGGVGLYVESGTTAFESFVIRGDDPAYDVEEVEALRADQAATSQDGETLDQAELEEMAAVALAMWAEELGVTMADLGISVDDFLVTDLEGDQLASSREDGRILVDVNAAGHGWYIDDTPEDDEDMGEGMDLLSALLHEIGHQLDYDHDGAEEGSVMDPFLSEGERLNFDGFTEDDEPDEGAFLIDWTSDAQPETQEEEETEKEKKGKSVRPDFLYELDDLDTIVDPTKVAAE
jgi:Ca2+-binding RTX toxin-like protein